MYQNPVESCATRIKKALAIRNMKQSELCRRTKIATSAMSEYVNGLYDPKQDKIYIMAKALSVDPVWLMGFDVPMEPQKEISPGERTLTEGERAMLELFRLIPEDRQQAALDLLKAALKMQ